MLEKKQYSSKQMKMEAIETVMPINRTEVAPKASWYGNYVRRFSISNESGKGLNVMDLYPYSSPGRCLELVTYLIHSTGRAPVA